MKKVLLSLLAGGLFLGAQAQMRPAELSEAHDQFRREHQQRVPKIKEGATLKDLKATKGGHGSKLGNNEHYAGALPANRWFPGEWEEVQAIVVTWPYWNVPANWQSLGDQLGYYDCEATFSGYGEIYKYQNGWQYQGFGAIDQLPYCVGYTFNDTDTASMNHTSVFAYLIDAIRQGGAEPWVRVTHLTDSIRVQQHMQYLGLSTTGIKWIEGFGDSFWFRDCGPICFYYGDQDSIGMLDFMYYPGRAIDDSLPSLIAAQKNIPNWITAIEWEGGNCVVDGDGFVMSSDHIYEANADTYGQLLWAGPSTSPSTYAQKSPLSEQQVRDSLAYLMGPRGVKILPAFQYDGGTGHLDLYTDMLDENQFVFSKFPSQYSNWTDYRTAAKNIDSMTSWQSTFGINYKKDYIPFPRKDDGSYFTSQTEYNGVTNPYTGQQSQRGYTRTYSNHTFVNNVIVQPCFSKVVNGEPSAQWDREYLDSLRAAYPGYTFYPIDVRAFDGFGGALHCITKQIPADNPIRILHPSITGGMQDTYTTQNATIEARITNRSGIASAEVRYRVNGGAWQTLLMNNTGGDTYRTTIPTTTLQGEWEVEYYIHATSNNGKSINKPYTGANGGAYRFSNGETVGISNVVAEEQFGQFYPNPATDQAHLNINLLGGANYSVAIIDAAGRTVHSSSLQAQGEIVYTINTARLQSGIYTVVFYGNGTQVARRLIVK
ncbi:MAG: agmatine deiminase family protein [Bacteroidales bacterium]|nr:agmatine deiminase family protein [Bacteroidales bacterium]